MFLSCHMATGDDTSGAGEDSYLPLSVSGIM
jgi:hypothetical protein